MNKYDIKEMVSKLGIVLMALFSLMAGSVMISQTNVGARRVYRKTVRLYRTRRVSRRRTKGTSVKSIKRLQRKTKRVAKRRYRKTVRAKKEPRAMKIERRGTDDAVSVNPKRK